VRICFVCLGNICRSPAAAAVFAHKAADAGLAVAVESAGTSRYHLGEPAHPNTLAEAAERGIEIEHRARQFTPEDFDRFDLLVAMDDANCRELSRLAPDDGARSKIVLLRSFASDGSGRQDVPDPWGLPPSAYAEMFDIVESACDGLVAHVAAR
jgi:low molecular weight protein-tyrosine phosphatase